MVFVQLDALSRWFHAGYGQEATASGRADIRSSALPAAKERVLTLQGWTAISSLDWAAEGRSIWSLPRPPTGVQALLSVDLRGKAKPVLQESKRIWLGHPLSRRPAPRHMREASGNSNAWLLDGF